MAVPSFNFYNYIQRILSDRVVIQMENEIYLDRPDVNPLLSWAILNAQTRTVPNMEFSWLEDVLRPNVIPLAANVSAPSPETGAWTFQVAEGWGAFFADYNTVFFAPNGTQFKVDAVTASSGNPDSVSAYKWPSTQSTCGDLTTGDNLIMSYPVVGDLQDVIKGNFRDATPKSNYCEQFMRAISMSKTLAHTQLYGGDIRQKEHNKQLLSFRTDQEAAMVYGIKAKDETGKGDDSLGGTIWRTGGIRASGLTSLDMGTQTLDYPALLAQLSIATEFFNIQDMVCLAPTSFLTLVNQWAYSALRTNSGEKSFGFAITTLDTTFGPLNLVRSRLLDKFATPEVFFINLKNLRKVQFGGLDGMEGAPKLYMNAQLSTQPNKILDFYNGFGGLEFINAHLGYRLHNWT